MSETAVPLAEFLRQQAAPAPAPAVPPPPADPQRVPEIGGRREGLEPTRYGDWEKQGRCIDF
ncbi:MAG TPA: DUF1674 domain-containing protein [Nevskiaceae bacterium]|nr:DUF1674 domain-containing protein [Nevskiaceae bacterium]